MQRSPIGRAFRAPSPRELLPRQPFYVDSSPTNPDFNGNPNLRPEIAWVTGVVLEQSGKRNGGYSDSAALIFRSINEVIIREIYQEQSGYWLSSPKNYGKATSATLTLESKGRADRFSGLSDKLNYQVTLALSTSKIHGLSDRDVSRLSGQVPVLVQAAIDYHLSGTHRAGISLIADKTSWTIVSDASVRRPRQRLSLEPYFSWRSDKLNIRLSISNLLRRDEGYGISYKNNEIMQRREVAFSGHRVMRVSAEFSSW